MLLLHTHYFLQLIFFVGFVKCTTGFTIFLSARDLPNMDAMGGRPDPYIKVLKADGSSELYKLSGQTGESTNNNNPNWRDVFEFQLVLGANQRVRFEVWDEDVGNDEYMGKVDLTVAKLNNMQSPYEVEIQDCQKPNCGKLLIQRP